MQDMTDVSGSLLAVVRDRIPTESSDTRKHIQFTRFVLEKINEAKPPDESGETVKKRRVRKVQQPPEGQPVKLEASQLLALANKASGLNRTKLFQGLPLATEEYHDVTQAKFILAEQLKILTAKAQAEELQALATRTPDTSQKRKTVTPAPKAIEEDLEKKVQGSKPQKVQKKESISPVESEVRELEKVVKEMDQTLRSLEPFTVEGLMEKERKAGGIREENVDKEVGRSLHRANETIAGFCSAYFHATALANQLDPAQGEELRKLLTEIDKRFGKLPVVEVYMKGLQRYAQEEKPKKEKPVPQTKAPQPEGIHTMKEIESGVSKDTRALIESQEKILTSQQEAAVATRSDLASARAIQYFGLYGQLAASALSTTSRVGASVGETVGKDIGKVTGALSGVSYGAKLVSRTGDVVATTTLMTQMPLWDKADWIIGATAYLLLSGATLLAQAYGIPAPSPWIVAGIGTNLATGPLGKRIFKPIAQCASAVVGKLFNRVDEVGQKVLVPFSGHGETTGKGGLKIYAPLLESAKLFSQSTKRDSSMEAPLEKKRK